MGIRILDGRRINDGNMQGAVLYESVSMLAYPFLFNSGESAARFLTANPDFGDLDYQAQSERFIEWQRSGGTSTRPRLRAREVELPGPIDDSFDDLLGDPPPAPRDAYDELMDAPGGFTKFPLTGFKITP